MCGAPAPAARSKYGRPSGGVHHAWCELAASIRQLEGAEPNERSERPTLPDHDRATSDGICGVHHNGVRCNHAHNHRGAHRFSGPKLY